MDIKRALFFIFRDRSWLGKFVIGILLMLVPFFGWCLVLGYLIETLKHYIESADFSLPEWDEIGEKFVSGLVLVIGLFLYGLPGVVLSWIPCFGEFFSMIYYILFVLLIPWIYIIYAKHGTLSSIFRFETGFNFMRDNLMNIFVVILLKTLVNVVFGCMVLIPGIAAVLFLINEFWVAGIILSLCTLVLIQSGTLYSYIITMGLYGEIHLDSELPRSES